MLMGEESAVHDKFVHGKAPQKVTISVTNSKVSIINALNIFRNFKSNYMHSSNVFAGIQHDADSDFFNSNGIS